MSSVSPTGSSGEFALADRLRNQLVEFVTSGPLRAEFEQQRRLYFNEFAAPDDSDWEGVLDWFLFDWFDDSGQSVIDHYLNVRTPLETDEQDLLSEWQDSLNSVFQIRSLSKNSLALRDLDSGYDFTVSLTKPTSHELFKKGEYVVARLLPLGETLILSGLQYILPDRKSAIAWLELRNKVDELHTPEEIEKAIRESCTAFCQLFGSDELTVPSHKLLPALRRFQNFLINEYRDGANGTTAAERYRTQVGRDLEIAELPEPPADYNEASDVTILCDEFDGIVVLPNYSRFKRIVTSDDPEREGADWKELVWTYIKSPDIPTVAFERVAEQHPKRVEKVMRAALGNNDFSIEHLYAVLLHYKEPVEGLEDMEDERQLWDLFNGNVQPTEKKPRRADPRKAAATSKRVAPRKSVGKKPAARSTAKTAKPAKQGAQMASRSSRKPATKVTSRSTTNARKTAAKRKR